MNDLTAKHTYQVEAWTGSNAARIFSHGQRKNRSDASVSLHNSNDLITIKERDMTRNTKKALFVLASAIALVVSWVPIARAQCALRVYNGSGSYNGKMESSGRVYNNSGSYIGKMESSGRIYNSSGSYVGKVESSGRVYNSSGSYMGKIENNGRVYNKSGSYRGKLEGYSGPSCQQSGAALILFFHLLSLD